MLMARKWKGGGAGLALAGVLLTMGLFMAAGAGCSKKVEPPKNDFHVHVQSAQGIGVGSSVQWRGVEVGRIQAVAMADGLVRLDVQLHENYKDGFREGVRARVSQGFIGRAPAVLELFGGDDPQRPLLSRGAAIPEAGLADAITPGQIKGIGIVVAAIVVFLVVIWLLKNMVAYGLAILFLVFSIWFLRQQWSKHGQEFQAALTEMQISDLARSMLTEEAAKEAWISVQTELAAAIREAGKVGKEAVQSAVPTVEQLMDRQADELVRQGKEKAAEELRKLQDSLVNSQTNIQAVPRP